MSNTRRSLASGAAVATQISSPHIDVLPAPEDMSPPVARVVPRREVVHGETRVDNYHWLRNRNDPEVLAYLEAENRYADAVMRHTASLQERLYQEMRRRIQETDLSVPVRIDDYVYYTRTEAGAQYPIFCRTRAPAGHSEEIILDQNALASSQEYFRIGSMEVSPDHQLIAYTVDTSGAEEFTLYIKDLSTGALRESIPQTSARPAWAGDSETLFYCLLNAMRRPDRLYRHTVGTDPAGDVLVYNEPDPAFYMEVSRTRSREYLLLDLSSHSTSEVRFVPAASPADQFRVIQPREPGVEYTVTHHADRFFITTNDTAPNFRLVEAPVMCPGKEHWSPVLPYRSEVKLDGVDAFRQHLVVYEREAGLRQIRIIDLASRSEHLIPFPEPVYTVRPHDNPEFDSTAFRFTYSSLVTPSSVVEYDLEQHSWTVRKQTQVRGGYDPAQYATARLLATAPDGVQVPVSLVYRAPLEGDGPRPLLLSGYGAYGLSYEPTFSSSTLSLLDRGIVVAIAHVRGGEELGRAWYEGGRRLQKRTSFTDFIACAEHLIAEGYTSPDRLVISGGSAGGLLIGAVTNLRPELFRAALAEVPFVDVVNTMLDATLPLTVIEYDEWGNPADPEAYAYLCSYSPYDNIEPKGYPDLLITAGLNDARVAYWEPAKWAAKLRATKTDGNRLLLRTNMDAGHGGASGRYDVLRETAFKYAFILDVLQLGAEGPVLF